MHNGYKSMKGHFAATLVPSARHLEFGWDTFQSNLERHFLFVIVVQVHCYRWQQQQQQKRTRYVRCHCLLKYIIEYVLFTINLIGELLEWRSVYVIGPMKDNNLTTWSRRVICNSNWPFPRNRVPSDVFTAWNLMIFLFASYRTVLPSSHLFVKFIWKYYIWPSLQWEIQTCNVWRYSWLPIHLTK